MGRLRAGGRLVLVRQRELAWIERRRPFHAREVDLDALDARAGRANPYAAPGGPAPEELRASIDAVLERFELAAVALTAYDPRSDTDGAVAEIARDVSAAVGRRCAGR